MVTFTQTVTWVCNLFSLVFLPHFLVTYYFDLVLPHGARMLNKETMKLADGTTQTVPPCSHTSSSNSTQYFSFFFFLLLVYFFVISLLMIGKNEMLMGITCGAAITSKHT
jgi:hypothetical protein